MKVDRVPTACLQRTDYGYEVMRFQCGCSLNTDEVMRKVETRVMGRGVGMVRD